MVTKTDYAAALNVVQDYDRDVLQTAVNTATALLDHLNGAKATLDALVDDQATNTTSSQGQIKSFSAQVGSYAQQAMFQISALNNLLDQMNPPAAPAG